MEKTKKGCCLDEHKTKLFIVIPTVNEEKAIGDVLDRCRKAAEELRMSYERIVVDGKSKDRTREIAEERGATVIVQEGKGYGDALKLGFDYAASRSEEGIVVMLDGDNTYLPEEMPTLIQPILEERADIVIGNRFAGLKPGSMRCLNRVGNRLLTTLVNILFGVSSSDSQSGYRALTLSSLRKIKLREKGMPFASEMLIKAKKAGLRLLWVPISYDRRIGKPKLRPIKDGIAILWLYLKLFPRYGRTTARVLTALLIALAVVAALYG